MIQIRDLSFRYARGGFELAVPELTVQAGERVAIVGPSGSGKTTLLHLIAGIDSPARGRVRTGGVDLAELDDGARRAFRITRIGLVFQAFELLDYLSVLDNVLLPYRLHPALRLGTAARTRALDLLERVGMRDRADRLVTQLSHGERQRVAICRALVIEPELVLADEPTGNLDPANKGRVLDLLCAYADEHTATLLTVTHDHDLLGRFERSIDVKAFHGEAAA